MKILLISSFGGHWIQLNMIAQAFSGHDLHFATTVKDVSASIERRRLHYIPDAHLDEKFRLIVTMVSIFFLLVKLRPKVVVTTGAAPGFIALFIAKLTGAKTIWIDSIANVDKLSRSGKMIKRFSDLWLTQWSHLESEDGPHFKGSVL